MGGLMKRVQVGCCGFPTARKRYYELLGVVELQNTFYELPSLEWAQEIRREAPESFEFTVKAWQVITHPYTSPTWRKMKKRPAGSLENYGYLKPTRENIEAFEKTLEIAKALKAKIVVLQTPSSMPATEQTIKQVKEFFENAASCAGGNVVIGWEVRGTLLKLPELKVVFEKFDVLHVTDIFKSKPLYRHNMGVLYTRLHGIGPGEVNYSYNYTDEDLVKLCSMLLEEEFKTGYVMFNNVKMLDNAIRFKEIASQKFALKTEGFASTV
ncbi:MAG: DUF72 domain-containing protein [Desulfurococcaceae archaeon]